MRITAIIPSLDPDEKLRKVVEGLQAVGFDDILLINDGSDAAHTAPFTALAQLPGVTVLTHPVNRGKGRALKTAFAYVLENRPDSLGVVTVDGDGQHRPADVLALARALETDNSRVYLGARDFDRPEVPPRSRFGNRTTSLVFRLLCGLRIRDTQTGLRAIPRVLLADFCAVPGERFEYETNMLLEFRQKKLPYTELPIETVYIEDNQTSHFRPVRDSVRIYWLIVRHFLRFAGCSLLCFGLDLLLFALFSRYVFGSLPQAGQIFAATAAARVGSSLCNFWLNRRMVFHSGRAFGATLWRYYLLCICQLLTSALLVYLLRLALPLPKTLLKGLVDACLFLVSYRVQQRFVF